MVERLADEHAVERVAVEGREGCKPGDAPLAPGSR
jgi:hypothetical protein